MEQEKIPLMGRGMDKAKVISVIMTESLAGDGSEGSPTRMIRQYWSLDGRLMWTDDPLFFEKK